MKTTPNGVNEGAIQMTADGASLYKRWLTFYGEAYQRYRQHVRMLAPLPKKYPVAPESEVMTRSR